ncbi:hypothetical protein [Sphingomonas sp. DT-207]|uniref:hypothetical protein n=1 Tax=Sphingomonas sp. DT-207 TaxID=3396167 RepID=UPI003F540138
MEVRTECGHRFQGPETLGAVSFVPANCERRFVLRDVRSRWASISLPPGLFARLWPDVPAPSAQAFTNERHPFVLAALTECVRLQRQDGGFDLPYAESMAAALVHYLSRRSGVLPTYHRVGRLTELQMRRVLDYIDANLGGPISISAVAGVAGVSTGHFFVLSAKPAE